MSLEALGLNPHLALGADLVQAGYDAFRDGRSRAAATDLLPDLIVAHESIPDGISWRARSLDNMQIVTGYRDGDRSREVYVGVPGTNGPWDWVFGNLDHWPVRIPGLCGRWVHGFSRLGEWLWDQAQDEAEPYGGEAIYYVFGHSYGGGGVEAMAAHAHPWADQFEALVALASPPVSWSSSGPRQLRALYSPTVAQRISYGFDIVPRSLPWFHHGFAGLHVDSETGETRGQMSWFRELWRALKAPGWTGLRHHGLVQYRNWIDSVS